MIRRLLLIAALAALLALPLSFGLFWINMVIMALIFSLVVFSINLLTGLTGLLSFGQAGFVGIGAYTLGVLAKQGYRDRGAFIIPTSGKKDVFKHLWQDAYNLPILDFFASEVKK